MQTFPLNYFSHLNSPRRLFAGRRQLSWPKLSLIFLFLVALMVMPITMYYTNQVKAIPMEQFLTVHQLIDQDGVNKFLELPTENGQINHSPITIYQNNEILIGSGLTKEQKNEKNAFIDFAKNHWTIQQKEQGRIRTYQMNYQASFNPESVRTPQEFQAFLEQEFYASNRPMIILSYSMSLGIILFIMTSFILFGASFFLWLTRKSRFSSIQTFKESANLMLNVIGVGSIIATIVGFFYFDFVLMLGIQSTVSVLLLLWIFAKTGFKDEVKD
ncbi:maltodextrose utilization protein MalA [Enterococcus hirae]|uniref:maltodextrose utilization protein MalA n=1 Tax=Enterococcus hirae TaxID=1354 RepID=UPI0015F24C1D|nr:maltodextrose utilization protein MalA [Enterococcus hirae]MBA5266235.1 maltodextrose utilization protein MalA [Enterococcus hirae]